MSDLYFPKRKMVNSPVGQVPVWIVVRKEHGQETDVGFLCRSQNDAGIWAMALEEAYERGVKDGIDAEMEESD